jgi:DNA-binding GntR family transcriptional regulator
MNPDRETIRACCDMRALLETGALRLAVASGRLTAFSGFVGDARAALASGDFARVDALDTAFHNALVAASGNPFLLQSYRAIADFVTAIRYRLPRDPNRYATAIEQHERILEHITAGNLELAETQLAEHVARVARMSTELATG